MEMKIPSGAGTTHIYSVKYFHEKDQLFINLKPIINLWYLLLLFSFLLISRFIHKISNDLFCYHLHRVNLFAS